MSIALARNKPRAGSRYILAGELSADADWSQTLDFPDDGGAAVSLTGHTVRITFRADPQSDSADLTISTATEITVSDADTLTIAVPDDTMTGLDPMDYYVDITSLNGSAVTHWASGRVSVRKNPVPW